MNSYHQKDLQVTGLQSLVLFVRLDSTYDDASIFPFHKIPPKDIYTSDADLFPLSGPWVAVGQEGAKDKSALFSLTGNSRTEQHLSPLIHYPPLHLASSGHHTSSFWTFHRA